MNNIKKNLPKLTEPVHGRRLTGVPYSIDSVGSNSFLSRSCIALWNADSVKQIWWLGYHFTKRKFTELKTKNTLKEKDINKFLSKFEIEINPIWQMKFCHILWNFVFAKNPNFVGYKFKFHSYPFAHGYVMWNADS